MSRVSDEIRNFNEALHKYIFLMDSSLFRQAVTETESGSCDFSDEGAVRNRIMYFKTLAEHSGLTEEEKEECYRLLHYSRRLYNSEYFLPVSEREEEIMDDVLGLFGILAEMGKDESGLWVSTEENGMMHAGAFCAWLRSKVLSPEKWDEFRRNHFELYCDYADLSLHYGALITAAGE